MSNDRRPVLVLFSGGRDSALATCLLVKDGFSVHLFTCDNGVSIGSALSEFRFNEISRALGEQVLGRSVVSSMGLFRRISLADIEADFATFKKNMIVLGSQIAIHTEAIVFCLKNGIQTVASGFTAYQRSYAEQMPDAIVAIREFLAEYDLKYLTPVSDYESPDEVKFRLLDFGVSTKSLEAVSIFADTFSEPSNQEVLSYIDLKLPMCRKYIAFKCNLPSTETTE